MKFAELLEETKQEGKLEGIEQGQYMATVKILLNLLAEKGDIPASLKDKIDSELNVGRLEEWVKLAIHSETIEEFENNM